MQLDLGINYGAVSTYRYNTNGITLGNGAEQRNCNWIQPLARYQIGDKRLNRQERQAILDVAIEAKGSAQTLRWKDWCDFKTEGATLLGLGDGVKTRFQVVKIYECDEYKVVRPITRPRSIKLLAGDAHTVDLETGVITFATPPPANFPVVIMPFEFDVPVRFEADELSLRFDAWTEDDDIFTLSSTSLVEVRESHLPVFNQCFPDLGILLRLKVDLRTLGGPRFNTARFTTAGGYENSQSYWENARGRWNVGDRALTNAEKDYFLGFFRCCWGAAAAFRFYDWGQDRQVTARFETDELSLRFDAYEPESGEAIYNLSGLSVVELQPLTPLAYTV
ncbi:MAG: DUF2460 domain-containing protein [Thermosynechococcaceae cyanobacterium MS004]|nr:DUF2460 domain-containing protein [Thermosynechococcaceae cyanobacterium MS004]